MNYYVPLLLICTFSFSLCCMNNQTEDKKVDDIRRTINKLCDLEMKPLSKEARLYIEEELKKGYSETVPFVGASTASYRLLRYRAETKSEDQDQDKEAIH